MGLMNAFAGLAQGLGAYGQAADRTAMLNLQEERQRYMMERERAEAERIRRAEMQQGVDNTAILRTINPTGYAEAYGDMGNRPSSVTAPSAGAQLSLFKVQEAKRKEAQAADLQKKEAFATAWAARGGYITDPTGEKFMAQVGYNPFEFEGVSSIIAKAEEKEAQRQWQEQMKDEGYRQAQILAGMRGGNDKTRYSLTQITDPVTGKTNVVAWDPENPTAPPIPVGGAPAKGGGIGGPYDKAETEIWKTDMKAENEILRNAQAKMPVYEEAQTLLDAGLTLDALTPVKMKALGVQAAAGDLAAKEELAKYEAYRSNIYQLALAITSQMKGQQSDKELRFAQDVVGGRMNITDTAAKNILSTYKKSLDNVQNRITAKYKHYESGLPLSEFKYEMPKEAPGLVNPVNATGQGPTGGRRPLETFGKRGM